MRTAVFVFMVLISLAWCRSVDELPHIQVDEWGVITWMGDDPVVSSAPGTPVLFPIGPDGSSPDEGYAVRAPVLYFSGPEFSGRITVETGNGSIYDIYPPVEDENRTHTAVTWVCRFTNDRIQEYPDFHGMAPGEWNYDLWRVQPALTITREDGWQDKFLYYETAPETVDFLPYRQGVESVCDEYREIPALVIKRASDGVFYSECILGDIVYGGDMQYTDISPDAVMRVLFDWSTNLIEPEQIDALWQTWSSWILYDSSSLPAYRNGMVLYLVPAELTDRISSISVDPDETDYPVDVSRYLLVAMPL